MENYSQIYKHFPLSDSFLKGIPNSDPYETQNYGLEGSFGEYYKETNKNQQYNTNYNLDAETVIENDKILIAMRHSWANKVGEDDPKKIR